MTQDVTLMGLKDPISLKDFPALNNCMMMATFQALVQWT